MIKQQKKVAFEEFKSKVFRIGLDIYESELEIFESSDSEDS